jgi:probable HAF family extracellular repeat protein
MTTVSFTTLDPLGLGSSIIGINSTGEIIGNYTGSDGQLHAFIDINGTITNIDPTGSISSTAVAINAAGQVVGTDTTSSGTNAFLYSGGVSTNIAALGSSGNVVGIDNAGQIVTNNSQGQVDLVNSNGTITNIDPTSPIVQGPVLATALAMNAAGQVVGAAGSFPFIYSNGASNVITQPFGQFSNGAQFEKSGWADGRPIQILRWHMAQLLF